MKALDLHTFPLDGLCLIEASAGTGKTYTLANLYLRYLLEKRYRVEDILVVTFTEAATQELKDRIRLRIKALISVFQNHGQCEDGELDPSLLRLYQSSTQRELDLIQLRLAERQIDQAEIYTIHGFCQRMLKEYALDSLLPLQQTLVEDLSPHIRQAIEDFWRKHILTLSEPEVAYIYQHWSEPESLLKALKPIMSRRPDRILPDVDAEDLSGWRQQFEQSRAWFTSLKEKTRQELPEVRKLISEAPLKSLNSKLKWLDIIDEWAGTDCHDFSFPMRSGKNNCLLEFTPEKLQGHTKVKHSPPEHAFFHYLETTLESVPADLTQSFLVYCYRMVSTQIEQVKHQGGLLGFDDLILRMAEGVQINIDEKTSQAEQLIGRIRQRYQVALIDEFQDTDKAQYGIFSTLFGPLAGESAKNLVLIGDPKQAIYAFRGGDIATYLHAKHEIQSHPKGELFTMATNWRSDPMMVGAVNTLFQCTDNPFMAEDIPFLPVMAGLSASSEGHDKSAKGNNGDRGIHITQLNVFDEPKKSIPKEQIAFSLAEHCVAQICDLLNEQNVKSSDIAVLVRSSTEAELIKSCLANAGVSASYEGKQSIYQTEDALAVLLLLQAAADPTNERILRRCMAEPYFGFSDDTLFRLNSDTLYLAECFDIFKSLHELWQGKGIIAMIREAMVALNVFAHWQRQGLENVSNQWERRLSNINQLAEILQQQAKTHRHFMSLVSWLEQQVSQDHMVDDENRMRLESDAQLVSIVTIHKSKGLEYPLVFLPFLYSTRGTTEAWFYDASGQLCLDLLGAEPNMMVADQDRMAEDMRLLYVALTRAKYQCYIGTCAYKSAAKLSLGLRHTAWGYLCSRGKAEELDDDGFHAYLSFIAGQSNGSIHLDRRHWTDVNHEACLTRQNQVDAQYTASEIAPCKLSRSLHSDWRVTSFTGLMQEDHYAHQQPVSFSSLPNNAEQQEAPQGIHILNFPKGSRAGTFLHSLFESVVLSEGELIDALKQRFASLEEYIERQLELSQLVDGEEIKAWSGYLAQWLKSVLDIPLGQGFALSDLSSNQYVSEMNFHFSVNRLSSERFNALMKHYGYEQTIHFSAMQGHVKGAIDLVLQADGRFYVVDYKSNFLGFMAQDYHHELMQSAMEEHGYPIQYLIYTLALHRYLKHRLGSGYCYDRHMGGVMYLFLRGLGLGHDANNLSMPGIYFTQVPKGLIESLDEAINE